IATWHTDMPCSRLIHLGCYSGTGRGDFTPFFLLPSTERRSPRMRRTLSLLLGLEEVLRKRLSLLVVMAAIGAGVLLVGATGSKVQASQPEHSRGDSSKYFAHQQGHKGKGHNDGLDPALQNKLEAAFEKSFRESGAPGAIVAVRTPESTWVSARGVADLSSGEPMKPEMYHRIGSVTKTFTATLLLQ